MKKKGLYALGFLSVCLVSGAGASVIQRTAIDVAAGAVGAAAAGPVGLVAGVAIGEYLNGSDGDTQVVEAEVIPVINDQETTVSIDEMSELRRRLAAAESEAKTFRELTMEAASFDILFATAKSEIGQEDVERLALLPSILQRYPTLSVSLSGFADPRGDAAYNLRLSEQRMKSVENYLVSAGVSPEQIEGKAYGARKTSKGNYESYKHDRAVVVRFLENNRMI